MIKNKSFLQLKKIKNSKIIRNIINMNRSNKATNNNNNNNNSSSRVIVKMLMNNLLNIQKFNYR